jgi:hypothetical protein
MTVAIDPKATFEWIDDPDRELPDDDPSKTVWELRALTPTEEAAIQDGVEMQSAGDDKPDAERRTSGYGTIAYRTVRLGLVRAVRNFRDAEGNDVQVVRNKRSDGSYYVTDASLAKIPAQTRARMCNAITTYGESEDDDAKK